MFFSWMRSVIERISHAINDNQEKFLFLQIITSHREFKLPNGKNEKEKFY